MILFAMSADRPKTLGWRLPILLGAPMLCGGVFYSVYPAWRIDTLQHQTREALSSGDYVRAHGYAMKLLQHQPNSVDGIRAAAMSLRVLGQNAEALEYYHQLVKTAALTARDHVAMGEPTEPALAEWHRQLPTAADDHPDVWVVRGMWAKQRDEFAAAARCFGEALVRDPGHRLATHQLSMVLALLGQEVLAAELSSQVGSLDELTRSVDDVYDVYDSPDSIPARINAAEQLQALGRLREAAAWYHIIADLDHSKLDVIEKARQLDALVTRDSPIVVAEFNLVLKLNLEDYPLPSFSARPITDRAELPTGSGVIRFADVAGLRGIDFNFLGADGPVRRARRIFEIYGVGIAVLDFDLDGWPDIYFAQGAPSRQDDGSAAVLDQLYWNQAGESFQQVTAGARLGDDRFSQGAAVGDFNNDGFPDLFLANVGENRLYQNNGDGTFSDVTSQAEIASDQWTTSCAMADLNGDSLPDIYEVNYLGGKEIFEVLCDGPNMLGPSCRPRDFLSATDRFWLNLGDGRFAETTAAAGFNGSDGKGLGVVIADFEGTGQLSVFVGNDTTANHFYRNRAPRGDMPAFEEQATLTGLAFDRNGLSQACMGIAIDDVDADGHLDLFVTNFLDEPNTLYRGLGLQYFDDASSAAGLGLPSLSLLGFGTQFLDADLDGDPDLIIANGHITSQQVTRFQMRPQLFENRDGFFVERSGSEVGDYFNLELLGRSLARIDFNRDGREDILVSHLDAPVALLKNETSAAGHFLTVRLVGVIGDRDGIGASVTVLLPNGKTRTRQLTAGDGYQCSNERQLVMGLGDAESIHRLHVRWPSGLEQDFDHVVLDGRLTIIEGHPVAIEMP